MVDVFRLNEVPSKKDLNKIEAEINNRDYEDEIQLGEYKKSELLEYALECEKHDRKYFTDFDLDYTGKIIQGLTSLGVASFAAAYTGDPMPGYTSGGATLVGSEVALKKAKKTLKQPKDESKEKSIRKHLE